jgi:hypothetical protein
MERGEEVHMTILVAYGTKMHGTEGLAESVDDELRAQGFEVDVTEARDVGDVGTYDAHGLMAGAMAKKHAGDWRDDARVRAWVDSIVPELRRASGA